MYMTHNMPHVILEITNKKDTTHFHRIFFFKTPKLMSQNF